MNTISTPISQCMYSGRFNQQLPKVLTKSSSIRIHFKNFKHYVTVFRIRVLQNYDEITYTGKMTNLKSSRLITQPPCLIIVPTP